MFTDDKNVNLIFNAVLYIGKIAGIAAAIVVGLLLLVSVVINAFQ